MKNKILVIGLSLAVVVSIVFGAVGMAKAGAWPFGVNIENVNTLNMNVADGQNVGDGGMVGGSTASDWNVGGNLAVTGTAAITGAVSLTGDLAVGDDLTITGSIVNGLETITATGDCRNATNTIVSFVNPLGKEAYIGVGEFVLAGDNGTSTVQITCGTSSSVYLSADPSDYLLDDVEIATSTLGTATTTFRTSNNSGTLTKAAGFYDGGTNSQDMMIVGASDYISCFVVETETGTGGWYGANNMANCTYLATFHELQ